MSLFGKDNFFYHGSLRKYTALFGQLFSDLYIQRKAEDRDEMIKVPIMYGRGYMYEKVDKSKPGGDKQRVAMTLPAMSFTLVGLTRDDGRMTNKHRRLLNESIEADDSLNFQLAPVPYDLQYDLVVRTKNIDDMLQVFEQIASVFSPSVTLHVKANPLETPEDVVIVLDNNPQQDDNSEDVEANRIIEWTFSFTLKGHVFRRTQTGTAIREITIAADLDGDVQQLLSTFINPPDMQNMVSVQTNLIEKQLGSALNVKQVEKKVGTVRQRTTKRKPKS